MIRKIKGKWVAVAAVGSAAGASAFATVPASITTALTDVTSVWEDVMDFKLGVFVFVVILAIAYKLKGR